MLAILILIIFIWIVPSFALFSGIKNRRARLFLPWIVIMILHTPFTIHWKYCGWRFRRCGSVRQNDFFDDLYKSNYIDDRYRIFGFLYICTFPFLIVIPQLIVGYLALKLNRYIAKQFLYIYRVTQKNVI